MSTAVNTVLLEAVADLWQATVDLSTHEAIQHGLETAARVTGSQIGYFHFVNDDQETLELVTWTESTRQHCTASADRHYPVSKAGVWVDCLRQRAPTVHNDYQSLPGRRGYPQGHAHLVRHMNVPLVEGELVRFIMGVGNKPTDYTDEDVATLTGFADSLWRLIQHKQRMAALRGRAEWFSRMQRLIHGTGFEWDVGVDALTFDGDGAVFAGEGHGPLPGKLDELRALVAEGDRETLDSAFERTLREPGEVAHLTLSLTRPNGERWPARLVLRADPRDRGPGLIVRGVIQDITEELNVERLRYKAFHDYLTELANRDCLMQHLSGACAGQARGGGSGFALHLLDLDHFKPVNDTLGHAAGDAVLKAAAKRLESITRRGDVVARLGGDEFAILQQDVSSPEDAIVLAEKVLKALSEPCEAQGHVVTVGVSIGIAFGHEGGGGSERLLREADAALYRSKAAGRGRYSVHAEDA